MREDGQLRYVQKLTQTLERQPVRLQTFPLLFRPLKSVTLEFAHQADQDDGFRWFLESLGEATL